MNTEHPIFKINENQEANQMQTKIQGYSIELTEPYSEGHTLTAREAAVLNQTRAENICNNARREVKKIIDEYRDEYGNTMVLPDEAILRIRTLVKEIDKTYEFGNRRVGATDPLATMAREIAEHQLKQAIIESGKFPSVKEYKKEVGNDNYRAKIAEIAKDEQVLEEAKFRLEREKQMTQVKIKI